MIPTEQAQEHLQRLLDPAFVADIGTRTTEDLRAMKADAAGVENALSYLRRLAQGRVEILQAEQERRARGGSVADLVNDLPRILSDEPPRPAAANTRLAEPAEPAVELHWPDGREALVTDVTLANLPLLSAQELAESFARVDAFERELSGLRRELHGVIDVIETEIATRSVAGTSG